MHAGLSHNFVLVHRNGSWWIPDNEGPIVVPAAIFHLHSWIVWRLVKSLWWLIKSLWRLLNILFMSLQRFRSTVLTFFSEMSVWSDSPTVNTLNVLWYGKKPYIFRLSPPTAFNWFIYLLNSALFRYERYIVCPKTRACQGRDYNFRWEWNVHLHRNSPQNVSALQWWSFALRSRYGQLRHGMDIAVMFCSNANSEYASCIQS